MPETGQLPEVTDVQRLTLKPGDRIIVRVAQKLTAQQGGMLLAQLRARLGLPDDVPIAILDDGMSLEVAESVLERARGAA